MPSRLNALHNCQLSLFHGQFHVLCLLGTFSKTMHILTSTIAMERTPYLIWAAKWFMLGRKVCSTLNAHSHPPVHHPSTHPDLYRDISTSYACVCIKNAPTETLPTHRPLTTTPYLLILFIRHPKPPLSPVFRSAITYSLGKPATTSRRLWCGVVTSSKGGDKKESKCGGLSTISQ